MASPITFTGLATGTDWTKIVSALVKVESYQINRMETWKKSWEEKMTSIRGLNARLLSLESFVKSKNTPGEFLATAANSSNQAVLTATASSLATPGAHSVTVGSFIKHKLASQGVAGNASAISSRDGTLTIYVGSSRLDVSVTTGMTLSELRAAIEAADAENILTAEILDDGSSANPKRLTLLANTGGSSNLVSVTANPTDLCFAEGSINPVINAPGWTGTSLAISSGIYRGGSNQTYTFTVQSVNSGAGAGTVGTDTIVIHWQNTDNSSSGDITLDGAYSAGTALEVENGLRVAFSSGLLVTGDEFSVDTFSNVDSVQTGTWSGPEVTAAGQYLGSTNKTFNFTVIKGGTLGAEALGIRWTDTEGNSGTISIPQDYVAGTALVVFQGVKISLADGSLTANDTFSIDVFAPTLQGGQDSGLARVEQIVHRGFPDSDTTPVTAGYGVFSLIYGGKPYSVTVNAGTTLSWLAAIINSDPMNPGIRASILNDGLGLSTSYHLVLTGRHTGAASRITDVKDSFTGGTFSSLDFETAQRAQNAMLKVDGYPPDSSLYIQRASNSVSDVIPGVTLSLASPGSATVSIGADLAAIHKDLQTFVTSINFVLDYIKQQTKYDAEAKKAGVMLGNYSFNMVASRINYILTNRVPGLADGLDPYTTLAQIGIKTNPDNGGKWEIDLTTLSEALNTNLEGVKKLFTKDEANGIDGIYELLSREMAAINNSQDGPMNILLANYGEIIKNIDQKIDREEKRIDLLEERLKEQFARLEKLLAELSSQGSYLESLINQLPSIGGRRKKG